MKEFREFETWVRGLELDWDVNDQKDALPNWLKAREDAAFCWAWNRAARQVMALEKKMPLDELETAWLEGLDFTVEMIMNLTFSRHDEFSDEQWRCIYWVCKDFQLLARATRLHYCDPFLNKLRAEYNTGRFPHSIL